jgi:DNA-binding CsgD family transcriptional regulator
MRSPGTNLRRRPPEGTANLLGRAAECAALDGVLAAARSGTGSALVLHGEAGIGKTALLDHAVAAARDFRVLPVVGVESEMELAFAALHQLCAPLADRTPELPPPQRTALEIAFGRAAGPAPDSFVVGLAVLNLLSAASEQQPVLCVVDDVQWLDLASERVLGFVARRLVAERIAVLFAGRRRERDLDRLPGLEVTGLDDASARALVAPVFRYVLDEPTCQRIVAETRGNPLALLELPRGLTVEHLANGLGLLPSAPMSGPIEDSFVARIADLPQAARMLLLLASAEPTGDSALLWRAAAQLGLGPTAATGADFASLLTINHRVSFRHPLARSAVYRAASAQDRRAAHLALAEGTDPAADPDRRAWHLASAASAPDEAVAGELERAAGRARSRGGMAAAAALLQRAVLLTEDAALAAERAFTAAQASLQAGEFDTALRMVGLARSASLDPAGRARAARLTGQIAFASGHGADAPPLLVAAADRLRPLEADAARETYLEAWGAALFAGELATAGGLYEASLAATRLPAADRPRTADLLLDGLATLVVKGRPVAAPLLRRATAALMSPDASLEDDVRWGWLTTVPSNVLWDEDSWESINARQLAHARSVGALARLPIDLTARAVLAALRGDLTAAEEAVTEADAVIRATDTAIAPFGAVLLAALRGREDDSAALIEPAVTAAVASGQGIALQYAHWTRAILFNGLSRYEQAFAAARDAAAEAPHLFLSAWALPELVEAGVLTGRRDVAEEALARLSEAAAAAGTDWAWGVAARCGALLSDGSDAEELFAEAVERLSRTKMRPDLARARLLHGEWLRRRGQRVHARTELRAAHELFAAMGMESFVERARRELLATGESVRKRGREPSAPEDLTPQERQIAVLVRDGLSNPEIGARLFLSPRTVEWHLGKIFDKLSISSRRQVREVLPRGSS